MKSFKIAVLTLALGLAGAAYAAQHDHAKDKQDCCKDAPCCCCKDGAACCKK